MYWTLDTTPSVGGLGVTGWATRCTPLTLTPKLWPLALKVASILTRSADMSATLRPSTSTIWSPGQIPACETTGLLVWRCGPRVAWRSGPRDRCRTCERRCRARRKWRNKVRRLTSLWSRTLPASEPEAVCRTTSGLTSTCSPSRAPALLLVA